MNTFPIDILCNCSKYLTLQDKLQFSSVTKNYIELPINRKKIKFLLSAIKNVKILKNFYNTNNLKKVYSEIIKDLRIFNIFVLLNMYVDSIFEEINYNKYIFSKRKLNIFKKKITYSSDSFGDKGFFLFDTDMCSIYYVPKNGKIRRNIKNSLLLRALIN